MEGHRTSGCPREHHFRSANRDPAPPSKRPVLPSRTGFAVEDVEKVIREAQPGSINDLYRFGGALHGFQDTFAHHGESQVPYRCDASKAWTHPKDRNGDTGLWPNYLSTKADHTFRWSADCVTAARESYSHLRRLVEKIKGKAPPDWNDDLTHQADKFCRAETKSAKVDWLKEHGVPQEQAIAQSTTLESGKGSYSWSFTRSLELVRPRAEPGTAVPADTGKLQDQMDKLATSVESFDKMAVTPEERNVLEQYLYALVIGRATGLAERMAPLFGRQLQDTDISLKVSQRLRLVDRGLAESDPTSLLGALQVASADIASETGTGGWQRMYVTPRGRSAEQPYLLQRSAEGLVAFALLKHAPYKVLRIDIIRGGKEKPRISSAGVIAFH